MQIGGESAHCHMSRRLVESHLHEPILVTTPSRPTTVRKNSPGVRVNPLPASVPRRGRTALPEPAHPLEALHGIPLLPARRECRPLLRAGRAPVATEARTNNRYHLARSHFERRGDALYLTDVTTAAPWISRTNGEILHVHETEGSMHVVMQPDDAQTVISAGWGELHPLAGRPGLGLPETYVFLYAPRDSDDADRIEQIIHRATATSTR